MVTMLLSMMEGNDKDSRIARQMVRTLVESRTHVAVLLAQFHSVVKLCDRGLRDSFQIYDANNDGFISARCAAVLCMCCLWGRCLFDFDFDLITLFPVLVMQAWVCLCRSCITFCRIALCAHHELVSLKMR